MIRRYIKKKEKTKNKKIYTISIENQRKLNLINRKSLKSNIRHVYLNKKSYYNFRRKYNLIFLNRLSKRLTRKTVNYIQFKIIKNLKEIKKKLKVKVLLLFFLETIDNRKKTIEKRRYFVNEEKKTDFK